MKSNDQKICIVMATFNGERYIRQQIESIQAQTSSNWQLLIRDDGSTDSTTDIVKRMAESDSRITRLDVDAHAPLGPSLNFSMALRAALDSDSTIFFIADQDDIWPPEKLAMQAEAFSRSDQDVPVLVHSDLKVVDEELNVIQDSMTRYMSLMPEAEHPLNYLLTRNFVTGCATAVNRKLLELSLPISERAIMHDWWLALIAAAAGKIHYIDQPLVLYRQHSANSVGAKGFWHGLNPRNNWIMGWKAGNAEYLATIEQARGVLSHVNANNNFPEKSVRVLRQYVNIVHVPALKRLRVAKELGLRQGSGFLLLIFYLRLLTVRGNSPAYAG